MQLSIYRDTLEGAELIGAISSDNAASSPSTGGAEPVFTYDDAYLKQARAQRELGISVTLPLDEAPYTPASFQAFFAGLLPEGEMLSQVAQYERVARGDYLGLIEKLGCESIGALTFVAGEPRTEKFQPHYEPVTSEFAQALREKPVRAVVQVTSATRLSLAGAQSKLAWFLPEGINAQDAALTDWQVPHGTAPSTHLIKLALPGEEDLALNELACARIAAACGLEVAPVVRVAGLPGAIAVARYDRTWVDSAQGRRVLRLHQEDFSQALGLPPHLKYQPQGAPATYVERVGELLDNASQNPLADKLEWARRLAFNYAIGNSDAHLKNSALLYNASWTSRRLAPLYDVTCIPLTGYSTNMAFDLGEHRALEDITPQDIFSIPLDLDISVLDFDAAIRQLVHAFVSIEPGALAADASEQDAIARVLVNAAPRLAVLEAFLTP